MKVILFTEPAIEKKAVYGNATTFLFFFYGRVRINWNHYMTNYDSHIFILTFSQTNIIQFLVYLVSTN